MTCEFHLLVVVVVVVVVAVVVVVVVVVVEVAEMENNLYLSYGRRTRSYFIVQ